MKLSRSRLLAVVAILLVAGIGVAGYLLVTEDDDERDTDDVALDGNDGGDGDPSTELTTSTTSPQDVTTSSTVRSTTTTSAPSTTTTVAGATTTSTTRPATGVCGTGTARVTFTAKDLVTTPTESAFVPEARVENLINRPIEVETLVADVTYPDGSVRKVAFPTTGVVIAPSTTATFTSERLVSTSQYTSARISSFAYFTTGQRDRCRVTL